MQEQPSGKLGTSLALGTGIFPWAALGNFNGSIAISSAGERGLEQGEVAWQRSRSCLLVFAWSVDIQGTAGSVGSRAKGLDGEVQNNRGLVARGCKEQSRVAGGGRWLRTNHQGVSQGAREES